MTIEFGLTDDFVNTKYAPLAALAVRYQRNQTLEPLEEVHIPMKTREFTPPAKLTQVLLSILAGCVTLMWGHMAVVCLVFVRWITGFTRHLFSAAGSMWTEGRQA